MTNKQKLELTWIGKEHRPKLEPRILLADPDKSYHAKHLVTDHDIFDNQLIFGDNLLALKSLEAEFSGRIKCVYIDPPFNTRQAFEHYDDSIEHSIWLSLIRDRIEIINRLLSKDGTLFVHIDDNELGYLTILLDEVFGRDNRISTVTFKQGSATGHKAINPGCVSTTNFLLIYSKDRSSWSPNRVFTSRERDDRYNQFIKNIDEPHSEWQITTLMKAFAEINKMSEKFARDSVKSNPEKLDDFVINNARSIIRLARPDYKAVSAEARKLIDKSGSEPGKVFFLQREGFSDIYLIGGQRILFYSGKLKEVDGNWVAGEPLTTLWDDILSNNLHAEGGVTFPKGKKPEGLIKRILELTTQPGDLVLDSFAGSGTTGAVAHKMGRRWIMVELGDHCHTHIIPRLKKVIDGDDKGGITEAVGWEGGGGFRYYRIAPSLLELDKWGQWVINKTYNAEMLAEALCKIEGFTYKPSDTVYWKQGYSSEQDFIYVTTQNLSHEQLAHLSEEVGSEQTLLVLCSAFRGNPEGFENLTVKKIPKQVLSRCEWGHDDYSLKVENLPQAPPKPGQQPLFDLGSV
jgi:adenine-specific DNA-methyltransferase